ncbi:MAG TPA: hypothetical protein VMR73_01805 [Candidatus Paceibacterota bacterium]|nr:hypothetical protein [Candidatus Paceibacterota bacterium]
MIAYGYIRERLDVFFLPLISLKDVSRQGIAKKEFFFNIMIGLTTGLLMLATAFQPGIASASSSNAAIISIQSATATTSMTLEQGTTTNQILSPKDFDTTEEYVRAYYKDTPVLAEIAGCESQFRQYDADGNVLIGVVNKGDIGIMQINKYYHADEAAKLGDDIYTTEGNLAYAKVLYQKFGTDPWSSSEKCWKPQEVAMK